MNNNPIPPEIVIPQPLSQQLSSSQSQRRFDLAQARSFIYKSVSEETRAAYTRGIKEFFQFIGHSHPTQVTPADVIAYRDHLRTRKRRKANTDTRALPNSRVGRVREFSQQDCVAQCY